MRLDRRLRALHPDLSWSRIRTAIERGQVTVDDVITRDAGCEIASSSRIVLDPSRPALRHVRLELSRLYEDDEILVIDKPAGLLTVASHPETRATDDTVLRRAQDYVKRLYGRGAYAGMLHRLDRDTSGALAIALTRDAHAAGRALFAEHAFDRWYLALVDGVPEHAQGTIEAHISNDYTSGRRRLVRRDDEGRHAVTHYIVRETMGQASLLELRLDTGRQHQIRLHLQRLGHALLGEKVYVGTEAARRGRSAGLASRSMLHAWRLEFPHPLRDERIAVTASVPADFEKALNRLRARSTARS